MYSPGALAGRVIYPHIIHAICLSGNIEYSGCGQALFIEHFSGAVGIVGEERLLDEFEHNPRGNLVNINVSSLVFLSHSLTFTGLTLELVVTCPFAGGFIPQYGPVNLESPSWRDTKAELSQILWSRPQLMP